MQFCPFPGENHISGHSHSPTIPWPFNNLAIFIKHLSIHCPPKSTQFFLSGDTSEQESHPSDLGGFAFATLGEDCYMEATEPTLQLAPLIRYVAD